MSSPSSAVPSCSVCGEPLDGETTPKPWSCRFCTPAGGVCCAKCYAAWQANNFYCTKEKCQKDFKTAPIPDKQAQAAIAKAAKEDALIQSDPNWRTIKTEGAAFRDSPGYVAACQAAGAKKPTLDPLLLARAVTAANWARINIPGANPEQILKICLFAFDKGSSVVLGGSRVRHHFNNDGNYQPDSDIDVGYGGLSEDDAHACNAMFNRVGGGPKDSWLRVEEFVIVPGKESATISKMQSPEDFFHRTGVRPMTDLLHAGQAIIPSGCVTFTPDGRIVEMPPGMSSAEAHAMATTLAGHKAV